MIQTITRKTDSQKAIARELPSGLVRSVTVVGLGNIGAELAETIARLPELEHVTLVDFDQYESGNVRAQNILPGDVGKPKVRVNARKVRQIAPDLQVRAFHARFEELALSQVRSDLLVSCLDSRLARTHVNEAAHRLNVPVLDGAVNGAALQGRVAVYLPGPDAPCLECQFSDEDYAALEQVAACMGRSQVAPTNAPAALGKFVAGMQAIEILKMVEGRWDQVLVDRQVFVDLRHHKHYVTRSCRNPNCRFDHQVWNIEKFAEGQSPKRLGELFDLTRSQRLRVRGQQFARRLICLSCRKMQQVLMLERSLAAAPRNCADCGRPMMVSGFDKTEWLDRATLQQQELKRTMSSLAFRQGEVVTIRDGDFDRHFEWEGTRSRARDNARVQQV